MAQQVNPAPLPSLGAVWDGRGTTFRLSSRHATAVRVELEGPAVSGAFDLERDGDGVWEARVAGASPGTRYGYRVDGPWIPELGHLFNPSKLLLDPYTRLIDGVVRWHPSLRVGLPSRGRVFGREGTDSAPHAPRAVVTDRRVPSLSARPGTAWRDTVVYECHVKGMTALHPGIPAERRGTYLGLASPPIIDHLTSLGVTAVELLPVQPASDNALLVRNGLINYWGYASIAFFAPDARFATAPGREADEFLVMVDAFHAAGIEVLLDVVYNHTGEGGLDGATVSFRGLDNASYYRIHPSLAGCYEDFTGCGNTLDFRQPVVQRLVRESLAFWAREMGVDGFRFDLAPVLGRSTADPEAGPEFLETLRADPALEGTKLIAEPWDLGPGGYRLGQFPARWTEWNGRYRDQVRRFWRGTGGVSELATRLSGSSDLFGPTRTPEASLNFVTCHDGFTLYDLVSYERKHNGANGEGNRDGTDWNESLNFGVEGPSADPRVQELRERTMRNLIATLMCSLGVPMLSHGDEVARTQSGNNNPWCQDNAVSWMPWIDSAASRRMLAFVQRLLALRRRYGVFRRTAFLHMQDAGVHARARWVRRDGMEMTTEDWEKPDEQLLTVLLRTGIGADPGHGWVLLALNAGAAEERVVFPADLTGLQWTVMLETADAVPEAEAGPSWIRVPSRSLLLLEAADATSSRPEP